jgi:hypothetical protein
MLPVLDLFIIVHTRSTICTSLTNISIKSSIPAPQHQHSGVDILHLTPSHGVDLCRSSSQGFCVCPPLWCILCLGVPQSPSITCITLVLPVDRTMELVVIVGITIGLLLTFFLRIPSPVLGNTNCISGLFTVRPPYDTIVETPLKKTGKKFLDSSLFQHRILSAHTPLIASSTSPLSLPPSN